MAAEAHEGEDQDAGRGEIGPSQIGPSQIGPSQIGPSQSGEDPDIRFSYANERTFLAWNRTALALIATGVAATTLLPHFDVSFGRRLLGLPLILLGAVVALTSYRRWQANEQAMRTGEPLPRSPMPLILAVGISVVAVIAVVLSAFD